MAGIESEATASTKASWEEINYLKELYAGRIRVVTSDDKACNCTLTIQPKDMNITIKFSLSELYPAKAPIISVRSSEMEKADIKHLEEGMQKAAGKISSKHGLIHGLMKFAEEWLKSHHFKLDGRQKGGKKHSNNNKQEKREKRKERIEKQLESEATNEKRVSMKTAEDVIKRIQWDEKLEKDQFLVGYLDRFLGIQEKYFTAFSWEDLASVDYTVLAIPKHRIQYFKYKEIIIWDKKKRLDNVFGSLGSNITVYDVVKNYKQMHQTAYQIKNQRPVHDQEGEIDESDSDESDSDDGITVTLGQQQSASCPYVEEGIISDDNEEIDDNFDPFWQDKMRPNYFLALRIMDNDIKQMAEHIQDMVLEKEPHFESCCIPPTSLHITLCTLGLDTPEQVANAVESLIAIKDEISAFVPKEKLLYLNGLGQFFNRVLYAKVKCPPEFLEMVDHLRLCLKARGIEIRDNHEFVPHMTIMKITRTVARETGKKYIPPWAYTGKGEVEFGTQLINNFYLCEMGINRRDDGFYMSPVEHHW